MILQKETKRASFTAMMFLLLAVLVVTSVFTGRSLAASSGDKGIVRYTNVCRNIEGNTYHFHGDHFTDGPRQRYYLSVKDDYDLYCFCIQYEKNLPEPGKELTAYGNAAYWRNLSSKKKHGITLTTLYGFGGVATGFGQQKVNSSIKELEGKVTTDDLWLATQQIVWEYTTGDRTSTKTVTHNHTAVPWTGLKTHKSFMTSYQWILKQMAAHAKSWSFAARDKAEAPVTTLYWSNKKENYETTVRGRVWPVLWRKISR